MRREVKKALYEQAGIKPSKEDFENLIKQTINNIESKLNDIQKKRKVSKAKIEKARQDTRDRAINMINNADSFLLISVKDFKDDSRTARVSSMVSNTHFNVTFKLINEWLEDMILRRGGGL